LNDTNQNQYSIKEKVFKIKKNSNNDKNLKRY